MVYVQFLSSCRVKIRTDCNRHNSKVHKILVKILIKWKLISSYVAFYVFRVFGTYTDLSIKIIHSSVLEHMKTNKMANAFDVHVDTSFHRYLCKGSLYKITYCFNQIDVIVLVHESWRCFLQVKLNWHNE